MAAESAGVLLYRLRQDAIEVFLVHPGGPFWARRDDGAWSIPKGELEPGEPAADAARRELEEETGVRVEGELRALAPVRQAGGKVVRAFAAPGDCDPDAVRSNTFSMEWPPRSGREQTFPEIDRAAWFGLEEAAIKLNKGQSPLLEQLRALVEEG